MFPKIAIEGSIMRTIANRFRANVLSLALPGLPKLRRPCYQRATSRVHCNSTEAFLRLVPGPDFKSGGGRGDTSPAGSIPVRFRHL